MTVKKKGTAGSKPLKSSTRRGSRSKLSANKGKKAASLDRRGKTQNVAKKQWAPVKSAEDDDSGAESEAQHVDEGLPSHLMHLTHSAPAAEDEVAENNKRQRRGTSTLESAIQAVANGVSTAVGGVEGPSKAATQVPHIPVPQKEVW